MESNDQWDFECPQFVDFIVGLENNGKEDIFFDDCDGHKSPVEENACKTPQVAVANEDYLTEEAEMKLLDRMTAALSIIENTPKVKKSAVKGKLLSEKFSKALFPQPIKSTVKPVGAVVRNSILHRSKSAFHLNRIFVENNIKENAVRKRSSSLSDLRICRKQKYPMTPMCLKRTIVKAKQKTRKTTEEMELEKIAELQKQLTYHLRLNEISLRKLGLKNPRPCVASKTQPKIANLKENNGLNRLIEKTNVADKIERRDIQTMSSAAIENVVMKIDNIINNQPGPSTSAANAFSSRKPSKSLVPSFPPDVHRPGPSKEMENAVTLKKSTKSLFSEAHEKNKILGTKKLAKCTRPRIHSGLMFHINVKKTTIVQPFSFDVKMKESKVQNAGAEQKIPASRKVADGKENISCVQPLSAVKKSGENQNELLQSNRKVFGKQFSNAVRGLALNENIPRN